MRNRSSATAGDEVSGSVTVEGYDHRPKPLCPPGELLVSAGMWMSCAPLVPDRDRGRHRVPGLCTDRGAMASMMDTHRRALEGSKTLTASTRTPVSARPWHLWVVTVVTFATYAGGARDYLLILAGNTDYMMGQFGPEGVAYFADYPIALRAVWTVNVAGGLVAPCLLLGLSRWSVPVAAVSALSQAILLAVTFGFRDRWDALGAATSWFDVGIGTVTVLLTGYCLTMRRRGRLH